MVMHTTDHLALPVQAIGQALTRTAVAHADETGIRVEGTLHWLHVLSTDTLTAYYVHPKRGREALDAFGLLESLESFAGTLVHDHWYAYVLFPTVFRHELLGVAHLAIASDAVTETQKARQGGGL